MKVSDYIARFLAAQGVKCVFEMSGGMITHMLDSMHRLGYPQIVSTHHEQAAAFAADAVGRLTACRAWQWLRAALARPIS
jgi:acetolactate synthase-1/2/3 large subunit